VEEKKPFSARINPNLRNAFMKVIWEASGPNGETKYSNVGPAVEEALQDYIIKQGNGGVKKI